MTKDMKKYFTLMAAALLAASFTAFAQNNNEVYQQAQQQLQDKQDALSDAERAHRAQQAESRRTINAAEREIDDLKANVDQLKLRIQTMKADIKAREAEIKLKKQALKIEKQSLKLDGKLDGADKANLKIDKARIHATDQRPMIPVGAPAIHHKQHAVIAIKLHITAGGIGFDVNALIAQSIGYGCVIPLGQIFSSHHGNLCCHFLRTHLHAIGRYHIIIQGKFFYG